MSRSAAGPGAAGFTLIEMMIVLGIVAIIVGLAVPGFQALQLTTRLRSAANDLVSDVYLARGEAIKRNTAISLCASSDGATCDGAAWHQGWIVRDPGGNVLSSQPALFQGFRLTSERATLTFLPTGILSPAGTREFRACRETPSAGHLERVVTVATTGSTSVRVTNDESCP